ncbi:DUF6922 domain-containing protein [Niastella yeongjuensis]|nr:hypothetical protein [Niastella yeongjuensis]
MSEVMASIKNNGQSANGQKPNLPKRLFWDWNYDKIDWDKHYLAVIDRVIERGNREEWNEVVHFYGSNHVNDVLKKEIKYLPDYVIGDVCIYFKIKKEDLACYARKQSMPGRWI